MEASSYDTEKQIKANERLNALVSNAFGNRFRTASLSEPPLNAAQGTAYKLCRENFASKSIFLQGNYGIGKTRLLAAMYRGAIKSGISAKAFTAKALADWMRESEFEGDLSRDIKKLRSAHDMFFIDDLDKIKLTESFDSNLFVFVDYLYQDEKILHISSNKTFRELVESGFNGATIRRLQDISLTVKF